MAQNTVGRHPICTSLFYPRLGPARVEIHIYFCPSDQVVLLVGTVFIGLSNHELKNKTTSPQRTQVDVSPCPFPFSVSMTTCSTLLALGMMPLCLLIYTTTWVDSGTIIIPYDNIGKSLLTRFLNIILLSSAYPRLVLRPGSDLASIYFSCQQQLLPNEGIHYKSLLCLTQSWQKFSKPDTM